MGALQMGVAREIDDPFGVRIGFVGPRDEHVDEAHGALGDGMQLAAHEQPQGRRDLVVATACGVHLAADFTGDLRDAPLDRGVDVFVARLDDERPRADLVGDRVQRSGDRSRFVGPENSAGAEHVDVSERSGDVVENEAHVESDAVGVRTQGVGTRRRETSVPQRLTAGHAARHFIRHLAPRCGASPAIVRRSLANVRAP